MGPARMPELGVASPGQNWTQHLRSPRRKHCLRPIQDQKHVRGVGNGRHLSHLQVRIQTQEEVDLNVGLVAGVVDGEAEQLVAVQLRLYELAVPVLLAVCYSPTDGLRMGLCRSLPSFGPGLNVYQLDSCVAHGCRAMVATAGTHMIAAHTLQCIDHTYADMVRTPTLHKHIAMCPPFVQVY